MCLECVVYECFINYLILNYTRLNYLRLNYLRLIYAQFLTSFSTAIFIFLSTWLLTSSSGLQPSTALANQLPGQLVSTQIRTARPNCFKFIIALIMTSTNIRPLIVNSLFPVTRPHGKI